MAFRWNPLISQLDLVGSGGGTTFDPNTILTHSLTPFGNPLVGIDVAMMAFYGVDFEIVFDASGNVVTL